jgi:hypothetical protein
MCDAVLSRSEFESDACLSGGGTHFCNDLVYCNWKLDFPEKLEAHINVLEIDIVLIALLR